ncbi:MAG: beta-ketoacyl-[acyl-carrier-protein] synthase family protein [Phycisphaerae bacterium]
MTDSRRVVITGLGLATPIGLGVDAVWDAMVNAVSGIKPIQAFDASGLACSVGGEVPAFKMTDFVPKNYRKSTKVMARDIMIAVVAAYHAVKDAGLKTKCLIDRGEVEAPPNLDSTRFGANIGAGSICADLRELACALATAVDENRNFSLTRWGQEGMGNLTPLWLLKFLPNMLACHVTIVHDAQAPSNTLTCGEASSHLAVGEGFRTVARGDADVCICGGAESKINPMGMIRPYLLDRLVPDGRFEAGRSCRPFSADRTGCVPAEGGGLIILEDAEHARSRGARIYAEVAGFGASANTHDWKTPDPAGTGISLAVKNALHDAEATPGDIDLIGTFGSGIGDYDDSELAALNAVFGPHLAQMPALATKGAVGINGAGNGAIDIALAAKAIQHNTVPPSVNTDNPGPACPLKLNSAEPYDAPVGKVVSLAYALGGGQNAALVLKRFQE